MKKQLKHKTCGQVIEEPGFYCEDGAIVLDFKCACGEHFYLYHGSTSWDYNREDCLKQEQKLFSQFEEV